jgi:Holliday junction resolvase RusA-like endonuclease
LIEFVIPGAPVGKGRPRSTRSGRHYTPEATRAYEALVARCALVARGQAKPFSEPVSLWLTAYVPIPASWSKAKQSQARSGELRPSSRPDLDNVLKAVADAMNGIVYTDDALVVALTATKYYSEQPRVEVLVMPVSAQLGQRRVA